MSAALKLKLISSEDYLEGELVSPIKHERLPDVEFDLLLSDVYDGVEFVAEPE